VNEIAQFAAPEMFSRGQPFLSRYRDWIVRCRNAAVECLAGCDFSPPAGGFYVTLRLTHDEEPAALRLLRDSHVLVHPGYFYDIAPHHLVMTFIQDPDSLSKALRAVAAVGRE
jgi:aspartate/methionine/tyrosine aminotransferase